MRIETPEICIPNRMERMKARPTGRLNASNPPRQPKIALKLCPKPMPIGFERIMTVATSPSDSPVSGGPISVCLNGTSTRDFQVLPGLL